MRVARGRDLEGLVALEGRCFPEADRFPRRTWRRLLGDAAVAGTAVTLVVEDQVAVVAAIVGLFRARSAVARIYSIAVGPEQRGKGLAQVLILGLARAAASRKCATLSLEVRHDNVAARGLYEKLGFERGATLHGYYEDAAHGLRYRAPVATVIRATTSS